MKYRGKPAVVEAIQWTGRNLNEIRNLGCGARLKTDVYRYDRLFIATPTGDIRASVGDYIIRGENGEIYPCKPDIFVKTYEEVIE